MPGPNSGLSALIGPYSFGPNITINPGHWLKVTRPDGIVLRVRVGEYGFHGASGREDDIDDIQATGVVNNPNNTLTQGYSDTFTISSSGIYNIHSLSKHSYIGIIVILLGTVLNLTGLTIVLIRSF